MFIANDRHTFLFLDIRDATLKKLAEILEECKSEVWLLTKSALITILEYMLWDAARMGLSLHLSGSSPCLLYDLERLLALTRNAMGKWKVDCKSIRYKTFT